MGVYVKPKTKYYVLKYPNGKYAGMDQNSGGYPFETDNLNQINYWSETQFEEMHRYMQGTNLQPYEVELHIFETQIFFGRLV